MPYICKRLVNTKKLTFLIRREKALLTTVFELYGNHQFTAALPRLYDIAVAVVVVKETLPALPQRSFFIDGRGKACNGLSYYVDKTAVNFR